MNDSQIYNEQTGFIIPIILFVLLLSTALISKLYVKVEWSDKVIGLELLSERAKNQLFNETVKDLALSLTSPKTYQCLNKQTLKNELSYAASICAFRSAADSYLESNQIIDGSLSTQFPLFNYQQIFTRTDSCSDLLGTETNDESAAFESTRGVSKTRDTCNKELATYEEQAKISYSGNFHIGSLEITNNNENLAPFTLACLGYCHVTGTLKINRDSVIVAGGDLILSSIFANDPISLTLISATGRVEVHSIIGAIKIRVISKAAPRTPVIPVATQNLLPDTIPFVISSLDL